MTKHKGLKVLKPFNTRVSRFREGDYVVEGTDLFPLTVASLQKGGFLERNQVEEKTTSSAKDSSEKERDKDKKSD